MAMSGKEAATVLAGLTGLWDVAPVDVRELAERGLVRVVSAGDYPLYDLKGFRAVEELREAGERRRAWWAGSLNRWDAAAALRLSVEEFEALAARGGLQPGRFGRYCRAEVIKFQCQ
jgi:hypothetical protein